MPNKKLTDTYAAVDLGSNSFHMEIARVVQNEVHVVDRLREHVRLADGLTKNKTLTDRALTYAFETLERFGERIRDIPTKQVRAVGTNTLRQIRKPKPVLKKASESLGHNIEIISGQEEARLIYLGVSHTLPHDDEQRIVIDIGGGSTELVIGEGFELKRAASLFMGCVSFTRHFFPNGTVTAKKMKTAITAARIELEAVENRFKNLGWEKTYGTSGTIISIEKILRESGWSHGITREGLERLVKELVKVKDINTAVFSGLTAERTPVFLGGVAILKSIFDSLELDSMNIAPAALRDGVLHDLVGRNRHQDARDRTTQRLIEQYRIDTAQAERVERTAIEVLRQLNDVWKLEHAEIRQHLVWACRLHEIGITVSYNGYQRHGAYIIANAELPGFSRDDQTLLATLIDAHRRKLSRSPFQRLTLVAGETALRLSIILRIAVMLNRQRSSRALPKIIAQGTKKTLSLTFPKGWLKKHPLSQADLEEEAKILKRVGYQLLAH